VAADEANVVAALAARKGLIAHGVGMATIDEQIAYGYLQVLQSASLP
jgi:hypothetical protein